MLTKYTLRCAFGFVLAGFVYAGVLDVFGFERFEYGSHRARQRARVFFHIVRTVVIPVEIQFRYVTRTFRWKNKNQIISDSFKAVPSSRPFRRPPQKREAKYAQLGIVKAVLTWYFDDCFFSILFHILVQFKPVKPKSAKNNLYCSWYDIVPITP